MTFVCSGDGEPLYWKPLLLPLPRSPPLRSVQCVVRGALLVLLLVSRCVHGVPEDPDGSMVTGDGSNNINNHNINNNGHNIDKNNIYNYIHNKHDVANTKQQHHTQSQFLPHRTQSQSSQLHHTQSHLSLSQSHHYYEQQEHQHQQSPPHHPPKLKSQHHPPQYSQTQQDSQIHQQQNTQQQSTQRLKREQNNSKVHRRLWLDPQSWTSYFNNNTLAPSQCLRVDCNFTEKICGQPTGVRYQKMRSARLGFCDSYPVYNVISQECRTPESLKKLPEEKCKQCFKDLEYQDALASAMYAEFEDILSRFDCEAEFSTHWNCTHCKVAYRHWLCSLAVRYLDTDGREVPPCNAYCEQVENRCPYFLPELGNQYAGEPTFACRDSVRDRQTGMIPKPEGRCYKPCEATNIHDDNGVCIQNANDTTDQSDVAEVRTAHVATGHENTTTRSEPSHSRGNSMQVSALTLWLSIAVQLGTVLWSSRILSQYWVIGLT